MDGWMDGCFLRPRPTQGCSAEKEEEEAVKYLMSPTK
jgi:hypothetical protein